MGIIKNLLKSCVYRLYIIVVIISLDRIQKPEYYERIVYSEKRKTTT